MIVHDLVQGSEEWHAFRAQHFMASDAPAMMGVCPHKMRNEFLKEKATSLRSEVGSYTQKIYDKGHNFEALAMPIAENSIGEPLYQLVGSNGQFGASFDGITMFYDGGFEHKTLNNEIRACKSADDLPLRYRVQMQHQMLVCGAERWLFLASKWDERDQLAEEPVHFWYESDQKLEKQIIDGWAQFEKDLADYEYIEPTVEVIGRAPELLPALLIEVQGAVTASNLYEFKAYAMTVFEGINKDLKTDEDFANADKAAKWCREVQQKLEAAKQHALSQTQSIDEMLRTLDEIWETSRQTALTLEKLVRTKKESIKTEKIIDAKNELRSHVLSLQAEIDEVNSGLILSIPDADFGLAIRSKSLLDRIQNAIDTELARAKIVANVQAKDWIEKAKWFKQNVIAFESLFRDLSTLIYKPIDDFKLVVVTRIEKEKQAQAARIEVQRELIRQEELAKIAAEAKQKELAQIVVKQMIETERVAKEESAKLVADQMADKTALLEPPSPSSVINLSTMGHEGVSRTTRREFNQDSVRAFLKTRDFGKDENKIRAALVEFVKFLGVA